MDVDGYVSILCPQNAVEPSVGCHRMKVEGTFFSFCGKRSAEGCLWRGGSRGAGGGGRHCRRALRSAAAGRSGKALGAFPHALPWPLHPQVMVENGITCGMGGLPAG